MPACSSARTILDMGNPIGVNRSMTMGGKPAYSWSLLCSSLIIGAANGGGFAALPPVREVEEAAVLPARLLVRSTTSASAFGAPAKRWAHSWALIRKAAGFLIICCATSASCGSVGSGASRRDCSERRAVLMVRTGDHFCERVSRQIAPWIADI